MSKVINIKNAPHGWRDNPDYVYIGRENSYHGLQQSKWFNPYRMQKCPSYVNKKTWAYHERQRVIKLFSDYLSSNDMLNKSLHELQGKILVCYCAPLACHGDCLIKDFPTHKSIQMEMF